MIAWLSYTLIVGGCVLAAAFSADWLLRLARRPVRFVWIAAAALAVLLPASAPLRGRWAERAIATPVDLSSLAVVQTSIASVQQRVPPSAVWYVAVLWGLAALGVGLSFGIAYARLRRARRRWPVVDLHGSRVRVAPEIGPVVVGLVRPEIVIPRWTLRRTPEEQRVIVAHEAAHVAAGDPLLLAVACACVAIMPWNPVLWIVLSRLRLAVELDCDARVLRGGVSPHSYGSLLVDVAESVSPLPFAATALADDSSHLHQRILAMHPRRLTHPRLRGATVALLGLAGLLAACEAKMPTTADIDRMDAHSAEQGARALGFLTDSVSVWTVDGVVATAADARKLASDSIATVNVSKVATGTRIDIRTKRGQLAAGEPVGILRRRVASPGLATAEVSANEVKPIIFIDGVRSDLAALKALDPKHIESVNVIKGKAAADAYGADALGGAIIVKTKSAGG
jgi:beta-lactamase regulating signal transducer with metallopeptidase domain